MKILLMTSVACSIILTLGAQNAEARSYFSLNIGGPSYVSPYYVAPVPQYYAVPQPYYVPAPQPYYARPYYEYVPRPYPTERHYYYY